MNLDANSAWICWNRILWQSQFSLFLCILKHEALCTKARPLWKLLHIITLWIGTPMHKRARKIMKRTKDHEHNLKRICTEIRYDFWKMTGHTRKMEWLEGKREGNWSDKRVKWKGHERKMRRKMRRTERETRGTSEGHERTKGQEGN